MANLSKLELIDSTIVTLKDNSQTNSDHRHYEKDIVPLVHKVYESNSYYATVNNWDKSSWYFASIKPDSWYLPWKVRFKIHSYCPNYPVNESITYTMVTGRSDSMSFANWNELQSSAHSYTVWYPLKKAGFDAGYGHAFGVSIYGANNYYNVQEYYRTFEIDFIECENCTVSILDNPVLWENWTGTGSTYYGSRASGNASSRGLQETGDADTTLHNRIAYFAGTTGDKGIWAGSLFMEDAGGRYQDVCTAADGTVTTSNRTTATTKKANTNGFKVLGTIWYSNTTYDANTQIGPNVVYSAYGLADARYSFNVTLSTTSFTTYKEIYLCGTIGNDGLFYLDQNQWWTQTPTDTSKIYILVGGAYDSDTSNVRFTLYEQNKWYRYDGTNLIEIANEAISVNGHTVETDVPSDAAFTDTTYTFTGGTNKITVTPSGGLASDVNITVDDTTKLPLTGGTLTGDVFATRGTASQRKLGFINDNDKFGGLKLNNNGNNIDFGWDYDQEAGAGAYFRAATYGSGTAPGQFGFFARSSNGTKQLVGNTNGILTWDGRRVVTSTNSTQIGSATKPVYVDTAGNVVECTNTLGASVPNNAIFTDANVTQSVTSTNANYEVLFSGTADNTTRTEGVRKNNNLTFNPNNGELNATRFTGITKEEYLEWGGRSITSNVSPIGAALSADHSANRFNYLNPAAMTFEYSSDGGTTWTNYNLTDGAKTAFVTDSMSYRINIGRPDDTTDVTTQSQSRITFTCQNGTTGYVYTNPKKLLINVSTAKPLSVLIETRTGTNYLNDGDWTTFGTYTISGQSGWNDIPLILGTLGGGTGQTGNNWQLRLTVSVPEVSASYPKTADIRGIRLFGENTWYTANNLAKTGHIYTIDTAQNTFFPANVKIKADKQVAYLSTTPTSGQVVVTDGASGGIKTTGYTIAKSVPSDAVFTDTSYTLGTSNKNITLTPSSGSAQSITVPYSASSGGINYCETDSSSTATAFVVNGTGLTSLTNGAILCIKNTKVTSDDSGCTIDVDGLGAKTIWLSETNSACKGEWRNNTTYLFVFDAVNDRWVMQTGRDEDVNANNIIARYSKLPIGGNGVNKYSLFAMLEDGTASSFTTNSGSGEKTFDNTHYFDIRKIFNFMLMNDRAAGSTLSASSWKFQGFDVDMRYSFTGVATSANTSSLTADNPVYLVFDPSATRNGYYKLKSPYYTQSPTSSGCIYVLLGVMRDSYRLDLWGYNPAFTYNGTNLVPFSNASFAGLADTYISNPAPCDVLMFDGADWINTNIIALKDSNLHTTMVLDGDTGDIQASSLNGAALGESPEFTDTQSDWNASSGKAQILNKPTLGTASEKDVPATGNASATQVVMGNDTRITETTETYGNLFSIEPQTVNGVTISVAADGTVTFNGTASKTFYVYIKGEKLPAGTYTAKMTVVSGTSSSNSQPSLRYGTTYDADGTRWVNNSTKQDTKTLNSESYVYLMVYKNTVTTNYTVKYQIEKGSTVGEYEPQSISAIDKEARKFIEKNTPSFIVPSTSIAVVGHEYNIYFDNIINGMDFSRYTVKASLSTSIESAKCFEKFFRFTPTSTDIGNNTITLTLCEKNKFTLVATCSITLKIIADSPISNKKVLFIGDSLTNAGVYEAEIQYNLSNGGITSLGTRETTCTVNGISRTVHHEGRGGWSAADYTRSKSTWATGIENPFYDEANHKFSFTYYMNTSGVDVPDIVCIGLGTNGNINCLDDILEMVTSIREYSASIPIIVSLLTPPAYQNGCGYYNNLQNSAEMKDRFLQCCENYIENYDNGEIANTDVAELYFHFDREYDFNTTTLPVSARNPNTMVVQSNNVHPSEYGYLHFADGYYNRILYWLTR